jgi:short-subunit dehydrogenase
MKIFLTGASRGIGLIISNTLKQNNIEVIEPTSNDLDLSNPFQAGPIQVDGLIHCAGINSIADHTSINQQELLKLFQINIDERI